MKFIREEIQVTRLERYKTPSTPNFIRLAANSNAIPIHEFSDSELITIAEIWKENLLASAENKRLRGQQKAIK